jgi:dTDP-4-dehydrorhamnose reductase
MKVLLLGVQGQLGHELRPMLARSGTELEAVGKDQLDVADLDQLRTVLERSRPRLVVNATAYNLVDLAETQSAAALRVNAEAVAVMGEYAFRERAGLIHYSTDFVFDGTKGAPYVESDAPNPISAYGRSKLAGERALVDMQAPAVVLRTAWVYSLRRKSFVSMMLKLAREKKVMQVVSDQIGSPTSCRELARVSVGSLDTFGADPFDGASSARGVYHAAGAGSCSRFELAAAALELDPRRHEHIVERLEPVSAAQFPAPAARPANAALDCTKLRDRFGVSFLPWREALARALVDEPG